MIASPPNPDVDQTATPNMPPIDTPIPTDLGAATPPRHIGRVFGTEGTPNTRRQCMVVLDDLTGLEEMMFVRIPDPGGTVYYGLIEELAQAMPETRLSKAALPVHGMTALGGSAAFTWGTIAIIESSPPRYAPPAVGSPVQLLPKAELPVALGHHRLGEPMPFGRLRVGSGETAGPAYLDLDYLFGERGGHCNISGMAGVAAKSSTMTSLIALLWHHIAEAKRTRRGSRAAETIPIPVILSVKGDDLMYLDHDSKNFDTEQDGRVWEELGAPNPHHAFRMARFLAPADIKDGTSPRSDSLRATEPFSWSLADVVANGLFEFLFDDDDMDRQTFQHLVEILIAALQSTNAKGVTTLRTGEFANNWPVPQSFNELLDFLGKVVENGAFPAHIGHGVYPGTVRAFRNRLHKIVLQGNGVLALHKVGRPPVLRDTERGVDHETGMPIPIIIDVTALGSGRRGLATQRFVLAAIAKQMETDRLRRDREPGVRYLLCLDELHRFAPHNATDPITKLLEYVAAEGRSLGILLIGAQQQASLVAAKLVENSAIRIIGHTGPGELASPRYGHLSPALKQLAGTLEPGTIILSFPGLRTPLVLQMPRTPWPMKLGDVGEPTNRTRSTLHVVGADATNDTADASAPPTPTGAIRATIKRGHAARPA